MGRLKEQVMENDGQSETLAAGSAQDFGSALKGLHTRNAENMRR